VLCGEGFGGFFYDGWGFVVGAEIGHEFFDLAVITGNVIEKPIIGGLAFKMRGHADGPIAPEAVAHQHAVPGLKFIANFGN
jgi:hypothetical protein